MKLSSFKILCVDDEPDILEILKYNLSNEGYNVSTAKDGELAIKKANESIPNLIIMDVMMPNMDGIEACEILRKDQKFNDTIIMFLTARGEDFSHVAAYEAGADDYVTKPVKPKVLLSKVKSLLRRSKKVLDSEINQIEFENIKIDRETYRVYVSGESINLPRKEFELLYLLASKPDKVFKREKIMEKVWGSEVVVGDRTIDVHIRKLREKIGDKFFNTVKGVLIAFFLEFFFDLLNVSSNNNISILLKFLYFFLLFIVVRFTLDIYIRLYIKNEEQSRSEINILKDQENYRREFLGNISHELKTPLFTIQGYILTLLEGAMKDKKVRQKYIIRAAKGVDRLISIVKDLDLITQFESGIKTVDKSKFNIYELVDNVFELMEFEAEKNNISLQTEKDENNPNYVYADKERIIQVLTNLVVNSIKYGTENGFTKVVVENSDNENLIIKVIDNGEGIEEEHLPRLFERFYRIDKNRSRKKGGSGLGLSIVKHIIEAHNQQIFVKSEIGVGTEFSFTLSKPRF